MLLISGGVVKSGSVVLYQYLRQIVCTFGNGFAPVMQEGNEGTYFDSEIESWVKSEYLHVVKLHSWRDSLDPYVLSGRMKVVMTYRDLRDTCLSVRDFRQDHFEGVIASGILQRIRDSEQRWRDTMELGVTILPIPYESMRPDPAMEIGVMGDFIGVPVSQGEAKFIAEKWSIHANRARAQQNWPVNHPEFMSPRHISSGNVDRWRKELTPVQCMIVQEHVGPKWFEDRYYDLV